MYWAIYWFWVWILDAYGYIEMDWFWSIIDPDRGKEIDAVDKWIGSNLFWLALAEQATVKSMGVEKLDRNDKTMMQNLLFISYPLISANMGPALFVGASVAPWQLIWYLLFPDAYVDENGYARKGWPELLVRTEQIERMLLLDYDSYLDNPEGNNLELNVMTFLKLWAMPFFQGVIQQVFAGIGGEIAYAVCLGYVIYYEYFFV